jgi:hypothetical protein
MAANTSIARTKLGFEMVVIQGLVTRRRRKDLHEARLHAWSSITGSSMAAACSIAELLDADASMITSLGDRLVGLTITVAGPVRRARRSRP